MRNDGVIQGFLTPSVTPSNVSFDSSTVKTNVWTHKSHFRLKVPLVVQPRTRTLKPRSQQHHKHSELASATLERNGTRYWFMSKLQVKVSSLCSCVSHAAHITSLRGGRLSGGFLAPLLLKALQIESSAQRDLTGGQYFCLPGTHAGKSDCHSGPCPEARRSAKKTGGHVLYPNRVRGHLRSSLLHWLIVWFLRKMRSSHIHHPVPLSRRRCLRHSEGPTSLPLCFLSASALLCPSSSSCLSSLWVWPAGAVWWGAGTPSLLPEA